MIQKLSLASYADALRAAGLLRAEALAPEARARVVEHISYDSKDVRAGTFFTCKGAHFKPAYLDEALDKGAFAYVGEEELRGDAPHLLVTDVRRAMALISNLYFGEPWRAFRLSGITGTKGKSTTVHMLNAILDRASGRTNGLISTIAIADGKSRQEATLTTPESYVLMRHLANAEAAGLDYVSMEVSSQALRYHRVGGIHFDAAVILNISEDHISPTEHKDFEDYLSAKLLLFKQCDLAVYNLDMDHVGRVAAAAAAAPAARSFSTKDPKADYYAYGLRKAGHGIAFALRLRGEEREFFLPFPGFFNVENALAAIALADAYGVAPATMQEGLKGAFIPGRMQLWMSRDQELGILVDYAHNLISFERIFESIKSEYPDYTLCAVFGCGGNKGLVRREQLGRAAAAMADLVVLTAEDPGYEDPARIAEEIGAYLRAGDKPYVYCEDRGAALERALALCPPRSIVMLLGKGAERYQKVGPDWLPCPSDVDHATRCIEAYDRAHPVS